MFIFSYTLHDADCPCAGVPAVPARHHQRHPQQPAQADSPSGEVEYTKTNRNSNKKTNTKTNTRPCPPHQPPQTDSPSGEVTLERLDENSVMTWISADVIPFWLVT